jgi:hypothetical protein
LLTTGKPEQGATSFAAEPIEPLHPNLTKISPDRLRPLEKDNLKRWSWDWTLDSEHRPRPLSIEPMRTASFEKYIAVRNCDRRGDQEVRGEVVSVCEGSTATCRLGRDHDLARMLVITAKKKVKLPGQQASFSLVSESNTYNRAIHGKLPSAL